MVLMPQNKYRKYLQSILLLVVFGLAFSVFAQQSRSANLTSVSVTLSNSRLSFRGALEAGNTVGSSLVTIDTSGYPSISTAQLVEGDVTAIGEGDSLGLYTVASTSSNSVFNITTGLAAGDADTGDDIISTISAVHTVRFTTVSAVANGAFRILVPALDDDSASADGIPDGGFFDFGTTTPTVECPSNASATYDFVTGTATASAVTIDGNDYHSYECRYSGTGATSTAFDGSANDAIVINSIINPAPEGSHTTGTADTHQIVVQQLDNADDPVDQTAVAVGVIEAVRILAEIEPQLTFTIAGIAAGQSICGQTTDVATTPTAVDFGIISISAFRDAAQTLTVSTNATGGYTVTSIENDQLGRNGGACTGDPTTDPDCIEDSRGDTATMTDTVEDEFSNTATKGFAYTLENGTAASIPFDYDDTTGGCTGTYCARQFADEEGGQTPVEIFSSTTVADSEDVDVCYRIIAPIESSAGFYENNVRYTATATF
jgi:hypothetical protein